MFLSVVLTVVVVITMLESFLIIGQLVWDPQRATPKERMPAEWKSRHEVEGEAEQEDKEESGLEDTESKEDESSVSVPVGSEVHLTFIRLQLPSSPAREAAIRSAQRHRVTMARVVDLVSFSSWHTEGNSPILSQFNTWMSPTPWRLFGRGALGVKLQGPSTPLDQLSRQQGVSSAPIMPAYEWENLVLSRHVSEDREVMPAVNRQLDGSTACG